MVEALREKLMMEYNVYIFCALKEVRTEMSSASTASSLWVGELEKPCNSDNLAETSRFLCLPVSVPKAHKTFRKPNIRTYKDHIILP